MLQSTLVTTKTLRSGITNGINLRRRTGPALAMLQILARLLDLFESAAYGWIPAAVKQNPPSEHWIRRVRAMMAAIIAAR